MIPALVLVAMLLLAASGDRTGRAGAVALATASVLFLLTNKSLEGPTLLVVVESHGLTATDLVGLTGLGVAGWRLWLSTRGRLPRERRDVDA